MGDQGGTIATSAGPKVGDAGHDSMIADLDAKEGARRTEKGREAFYAMMGQKAPKEGEADVMLDTSNYVPGQPTVKVPEKEKQERKSKPEKRERKEQPALKSDAEIARVMTGETEADETAEEAPEADEEETTEEGVSPESEEAESESDEEEPSSELEEEITILRRAKIPQSVLKKMTQAEISRLAAVERVRQSHTDDLGRQLGEAKKKESGDGTSAESGRVMPPEQPAKNSLVEPFLKILGDDAAPALAEVDQALDARLSEAKNQLTAMYVDDLLDDAREALKERFPELLNDTFFKSVIRPEMSVLGQSKLTKLEGATKRAKFQSLMERAARNAREAKGLGESRGDKSSAAPTRKHGTVSPPKRVQAPPKIGTGDRAEKSWEMLIQGIDRREVRRRLDSRA